MNHDDIIYVTLHHRRSLFYEVGIRLLLDDGAKFLLVHTGQSEHFGKFGITNYGIKHHYCDLQTTYDQGVVLLKDLLADMNWKAVVFLDNDLFLTDIKYLKENIKDFFEQNYDYCSYFENGSIYKPEYEFKGTIAQVTDQKFDPADIYPGFKPNPHWENAQMIIKRTMWDQLSKEDVSHGRLMWKAIFEKGGKMGVKKANYRETYTHFGQDWLHIGNLTAHYYKLEKHEPFSDSFIDLSRIGYFIAQRNIYGRMIYSQQVNDYLDELDNHHGYKSPIQAWRKLVEGTCYEEIF